MKSKPLEIKLAELSAEVLKDNRRQIGVYAMGIDSKKLMYGFDKRSLELALKGLKDKGYRGEIYFYVIYGKN